MKADRIFALSLDLTFPEGIAPGSGREGSHAVLARDGRGRPVLRGTALAGVLRHAYESGDGPEADLFFGCLTEDGDGRSRLQIPDIPLDTGGQEERTGSHIRINRHSGMVADQALFSIESCPPGTSAKVVLWLEAVAGDDDANFRSFLERVAGILEESAVLGGSGSRGMGRVECVSARLRDYDLGNIEDYAAYLDDHRSWRENGTQPGGENSAAGDHGDDLQVELRFTIPRGQDILIADGRGTEHDMEPQKVTHADGNCYWRLPGSALRGLFRDWIVRLAVRDGEEGVFDSGADRRPGDFGAIPGHEHGLAGVAKAEDVTCPVANLFGTLHRRGRIHISDGYAQRNADQEQVRMHVAVDGVTGGARDEGLFSNVVVVSPPDHPVIFPVTIRISDPQEREVRWLARTIMALDQGVIRVGSSKSAGCLCLAERPRARGPHHEIIQEVEPTRTG